MKNFISRALVAASLLILFTHFALANPTPYDEKADAAAQINQALAQAKTQHKNVLLIFGANWCKDCIELDRSIKTTNAALMNKKFVIVKINIGQYDANMDIANKYGNPTKKGIPAAVLISPDNSTLYATHGGELADARHMSDQGIYDFFNKIVTQAKQ